MSRKLVRIITDDEADFRVLSLGKENGKFAVPVNATGGEDLWRAFERGLDNDWYRLIDIVPVTAAQGRLSRVFRLTDAGRERLKQVTPPEGSA
jgi:hypothetical protein